MIIIGIVLSFIGLSYLCWLVFALAVNALPLFAGVTAGTRRLSQQFWDDRSGCNRCNCQRHRPVCRTARL